VVVRIKLHWIGVAISIAYAVSSIHTTPLDAALNVAGGVVVSPAIGALIGYVARRFNKLTFGGRLLVALGDLYLATYLFLLAAGLGGILAQLVKGRAVDLQRSLVVGPLIGTLLGLTYTGFVLASFPLSYLNHVLIGKAWDDVRRSQDQPANIGSEPSRPGLCDHVAAVRGSARAVSQQDQRPDWR